MLDAGINIVGRYVLRKSSCRRPVSRLNLPSSYIRLNQKKYYSKLNINFSFKNNFNPFIASRIPYNTRCVKVEASIRGDALSAAEVKQRAKAEEQAKRVALLIHEWNALKPFDPEFNLAAYIWRQASLIGRDHMHLLLDYLESEDIHKLWRISSKRFDMPNKLQWDAATDFAFDPMKELRGGYIGSPQKVYFEGRAANIPTSALNRFQKVFVSAPQSDHVFGRVLLGKGDLVSSNLPLYFKVVPGESVPHTGEAADACLVYGGPEVIPHTIEMDDKSRVILEHKGSTTTWPPPHDPIYPFSELKDYVRLVAPGVFVGIGWRAAALLPPKQFLSFVLVQRYEEHI